MKPLGFVNENDSHNTNHERKSGEKGHKVEIQIFIENRENAHRDHWIQEITWILLHNNRNSVRYTVVLSINIRNCDNGNKVTGQHCNQNDILRLHIYIFLSLFYL